MTPHAPELPETFKSWIDELNPLGLMLQKMLMTSVAYNDGIYAREQSLVGNHSILPLALIFLCGRRAARHPVVQGERDRRQLRIVLAAKEREAVLRESLRAALDAMPVIIVIFDPQTETIAYASPPALATVRRRARPSGLGAADCRDQGRTPQDAPGAASASPCRCRRAT